MSLQQTPSTGTTALTNALKEVFYIHKDVVSELKTKMDSLHRDNEHLKTKLDQVSPHGRGKCDSCSRLLVLNRTLHENFNSRLKDKNAIIKHLEKKLKLRTADDDDTLCTETLTLGVEERSTCDDSDLATLTSNNADGSFESQEVVSPKDAAVASRQNTRLRLTKDGRKRSRYVEEPPDPKRQKTSPVGFNQSQNPNTDSSPLRHQNPYTDSSPLRHQNPNANPSPLKHQNPNANPNPLKHQNSNANPSPLKHQNLIANFNPLKPQNPNANPSPLRHQNPNANPSPLRHQNHNVNSNPLKHQASASLKSGLADKRTEEKKSTETVLVTETELNSLPVEFLSAANPSESSEAPVIRTRSANTKDGACGGRHDLVKSKNNVIPDTLGFESGPDCSDDNDDDDECCDIGSEPFILHQDSNQEEAFGPEIRQGALKSLDVSVGCHDDFNCQATLTCGLEASPSPSIFQEVAKKRSQGDTPTSAPHPSDVRYDFSSSPSPSSSSHVPKPQRNNLDAKLPVPRPGRTSGRAFLRQATLSQTFAGDSVRTTRGKSHSAIEPHDADLERAIRASLQENPIIGCGAKERLEEESQTRNKPSDTHSFKIHLSPLRADGGIKVNPNQRGLETKGQGSPKPHAGSTRTSPRLSSKSAKSLSESPDTTLKENARKSLFNGKHSPIDGHKRCQDKRGKPSQSANVDSGRREEEDEWKGSPDRKQNAGHALDAMNGSLNPDVQLSMYLDGQNTNAASQLLPSSLDETVAPSHFAAQGSHSLYPMGDAAELEWPADPDLDPQMNESMPCVGDLSQEDVEESIAPSPEQRSSSSMKCLPHSQSLPCASIPSSSRSFKFTGKSDAKSAMTAAKTDKEVHRMTRKDNPTAQQQLVDDSFDVFPRGPEEFPHVMVVRKKSEKDKLQGFSCKQCYEYYKDLNLTDKELKQRIQICSRHKEKYQAPPTPEHFWSLSIPDTVDVEDDDARKESAVAVRLPRRRRRLEMRFKSKDEEGGGT